jgi:hypothetical protein
MSRVGINVDRTGRHDAGWIRAFNAQGARIVLTRYQDLRPLFMGYESAGVHILAVLARESFDGSGSWGEALAFYSRQYGQWLSHPGTGSIQVGNEADHVSPSSWDMPQADLSLLGAMTRKAFPNAYLVCSGLTSGQPSYLEEVELQHFNAIAVHPYAKNATPDDDLPQAQDLVREYRRFNKPIWITEWGWWGDERRGDYEVRNMVSWARDTQEIEWYFHFCADDLMVPPFGLLRADGTWKPAAQSFFLALHETEPPVPKEPELGWIGDGLLQKLEQHNLTPTSGEHVTTYPLVWAKTSTGKDAVVIWDTDKQEATAYRRI